MVAFPPPPVTFPATRPASCNVSDWAPFRTIISIRRCLFLSKQLVRSEDHTQPSLSASTPGVMDSGFPLLLSSNGVSPRPFHLPVPVRLPVSNPDCENRIHPFFSMSRRKYFNYCPIDKVFLWKSCGKSVDNISRELWISLCKTVQIFCRQ